MKPFDTTRAWPNGLLFNVPVCIVGTTGLATAFATSFPTELGEACDVFLTPEEILPEWFLLLALGTYDVEDVFFITTTAITNLMSFGCEVTSPSTSRTKVP